MWVRVAGAKYVKQSSGHKTQQVQVQKYDPLSKQRQ